MGGVNSRAAGAGYAQAVRVTWIVVGLLVAAAGAVWTLQGFNVSFAPRSFMTGNGVWIALGLAALVAGLALAAWGWRHS